MDRNFSIKFGRVYFACNTNDFNKEKTDCSSSELINLLKNSNKDKYIKDGQICLRRICHDVVYCADNYIDKYNVIKSTINIASFVSRKQYVNLMNVFDKKSGSVSCFALVILAGIYKTVGMNHCEGAKELLLKYVGYIYEGAKHTNDNSEACEYLLKSYSPVQDYINSDGKIDLEFSKIIIYIWIIKLIIIFILVAMI